MHKLFSTVMFLFFLFLVGIALANNSSIERPLDRYFKAIYRLFTQEDGGLNDKDNPLVIVIPRISPKPSASPPLPSPSPKPRLKKK